MAVCFEPGQELGRGDLDIFLQNAPGNAANAYAITFSLFYVTFAPGVPQGPGTETLIGAPNRTPVNPAVGEYYAPVMIPTGATPGDYRIRWTFQQLAGSPLEMVVQEFGVVAAGSVTSIKFSPAKQECIRRLRIYLRDNNPDRNYRFCPPEHECDIGAHNRVFGYVWTDEELCEYLQGALEWWNMMPPETESLCTIDLLVQNKPTWKMAIIWGAISHAAVALAFNWAKDEFDYSIGGISLSIDKSSKYESLKSNAEGQMDKAVEAKARTTKFMRGLQQPRFGRGIRSAFGPHVGRGVLSPRNFL